MYAQIYEFTDVIPSECREHIIIYFNAVYENYSGIYDNIELEMHEDTEEDDESYIDNFTYIEEKILGKNNTIVVIFDEDDDDIVCGFGLCTLDKNLYLYYNCYSEIKYLKTILNELEIFIRENYSSTDIEKNNIYCPTEDYDNMDVKKLMYDCNYHKIKISYTNKCYLSSYAKALGDTIDQEEYFDIVDDKDKIKWVFKNRDKYQFCIIPLDNLKKCISLTDLDLYEAHEILSCINDYGDLERYEAIYCSLVKNIYKLDREMTLTEIIRKNYLLLDAGHYYYQENEITKKYGLFNKQQYFLRFVNKFEVKKYSKVELMKIIKKLLLIADTIRGKENKLIVVKKIYDLFGENIWFLLSHDKFLDGVINKINEFSKEESQNVLDVVAELQYMKFLKN
jgi:hypothetical protein